MLGALSPGKALGKSMRRLIMYALFLLALAGTVGAFSWHQRARSDELAEINRARASLQRLERELKVRAATGQCKVNGRGWPDTVEPEWFTVDPPINPLVPIDRPWLEIAGAGEEALMDPPLRQTVTSEVASYWYNPATGVVRARVGPRISDRSALRLYNQVNGTSLKNLIEAGAPKPQTTHTDLEAARAATIDPNKPRPLIIVRPRSGAPESQAQAPQTPE